MVRYFLSLLMITCSFSAFNIASGDYISGNTMSAVSYNDCETSTEEYKTKQLSKYIVRLNNLSVNGVVESKSIINYNGVSYTNREWLMAKLANITVENILKDIVGTEVIVDESELPYAIYINNVKYELIRNIVNGLKYNVYWDGGTSTVHLDRIDYLNGLINSVNVEATIINDVNVYSDYKLSKVIGTIKAGTRVIFIRDKGEYAAQVKVNDRLIGWVRYNAVKPSDKNYSDKGIIKGYIKEYYVNNCNYTSDTNYLVWVNIEREDVNVFIREYDRWKLIKEIKCSSGKNSTPTVNGTFKYYKFVNKYDFGKYYIENFMMFAHDVYGIHTVPLNPNGTVQEGKLGVPLSHGCVRVGVEDSKWLKGNIPLNTTIIIN